MEIMKSIRLQGKGDLQICDEPIPVADEEGKLLRIKAVRVCGSDLDWFQEGLFGDGR
jgi:threonine dehydrogenase-like Zn-dependent dehydrogenase